VREGIAVRTGDRSRSELTFPDITITRLGANTVFSFNQAGRSVDLTSGSVLLRVPKNSGGGNIRTNVVSVAVTGTTLVLEATRNNKLYILEGGARTSLVKYRGQTRNVAAGQMFDVPPGAKTLPMPQNFDINKFMQNHPLVTNFPPLPSRGLIAEAAQNQRPPAGGPGGEPVYQGQPVSGDPNYGPGISIQPNLPGILIPGLFPGSHNPGRPPGHGHGDGHQDGTPTHTSQSGQTSGNQVPGTFPGPKKTTFKPGHVQGQGQGVRRLPPKKKRLNEPTDNRQIN
jgi:hypothetical protein